MTYPSHTTIVTGALSSEHGIYFNTLFSVEEGSSPLWYWDSKAIRVPTLWQKARAQGRTTAIMTWPVSVGADVDWLVPEIFPADPESSTEKTWDLTRKNMNSDFLAELSANNEEPELAGFEPRDRWIANAANYMSRKYRPDLMLIHLSNVDNVEHNTGKNSPKTRAALAQADAQIAKILEPIDLSRTTVIILGDHGFYDFDKVIDINTLFEKKKWLRVEATPGSVPKCIQGCSTAEPKVAAPWTTQKGFRIASDW